MGFFLLYLLQPPTSGKLISPPHAPSYYHQYFHTVWQFDLSFSYWSKQETIYESIDAEFKMDKFSKARKKLGITAGCSKPVTICCDTAVPGRGWALSFVLVGPEGEVQCRQVTAEAIFPWMWKKLF